MDREEILESGMDSLEERSALEKRDPKEESEKVKRGRPPGSQDSKKFSNRGRPRQKRGPDDVV